MLASQYGHTEVVQALLSSGATVDLPNKYGGSPLAQASRWGRLGVLPALLSAGTDLELQDRNGDTALHLACYKGHKEVVASLLSTGAQPGSGSGSGLFEFDEGHQVRECWWPCASVVCHSLVIVSDYTTTHETHVPYETHVTSGTHVPCVT